MGSIGTQLFTSLSKVRLSLRQLSGNSIKNTFYCSNWCKLL